MCFNIGTDLKLFLVEIHFLFLDFSEVAADRVYLLFITLNDGLEKTVERLQCIFAD